MQAETLKADVYEYLASFAYDPLGYTLAAFPWAEGELTRTAGPYKWQTEVLAEIRDWLANPETRYQPFRKAIASGHGIGKTALVAFITKWAMGTCADAKVVITANTATQLTTKTSPELAKWFRLALDSELWDAKATSVTSRVPGSEKTWRTDLIPWSENNSEAFAGLHNKERLILVIFDEASGIADVIWDTAQGALTDERTIIIWLAFGNPTLNTGRFFECFGVNSATWHPKQIDSRTVEGTNKAEIAKWAESRGEDSDFFRVRVRGEFPRQGNAQFIPSDVVFKARHYTAQGYQNMPKVLVCDVARFGEDSTVIGLRQGRKFSILESFHEKPTDYTGERVIAYIRAEKPDATVIDETGVGGGVVDYVRARGYNSNNGYTVFGFNGGSDAIDETYYNRRAECYGLAKEWLTAGAEIPDDPELDADLTGVTFDYAKGKAHFGSIILESKDEMKKRGLRSPDKGDVLAMSFHANLAPRPEPEKPEYPLHGPQGADAWMA